MAIHHMKLKSDYFKKISRGTTTIECRLFDEKRRELKIGDTIEFTDTNAPGKKIEVAIAALHLFPSFSILFDRFPHVMFGGDNKEQFLAAMKAFYSEEDEKKYGVIAIEVKPIVV